MVITTKKEYNQLRDEVLSKTSGANIHDINGLLGRISHKVNTFEDPDQEFWSKYREEYEKDIEEYIDKIYKLII